MIKNRNINKIKLNGSVEIKRINKFIWKNCTCGGGLRLHGVQRVNIFTI